MDIILLVRVSANHIHVTIIPLHKRAIVFICLFTVLFHFHSIFFSFFYLFSLFFFFFFFFCLSFFFNEKLLTFVDFILIKCQANATKMNQSEHIPLPFFHCYESVTVTSFYFRLFMACMCWNTQLRRNFRIQPINAVALCLTEQSVDNINMAMLALFIMILLLLIGVRLIFEFHEFVYCQ